MKPTVVFSCDDFRLVRTNTSEIFVEYREGCDWMGKKRWKCIKAVKNKEFKTIALTGEQFSSDWIREGFVRELVNQLGEELYRQRKNGKRKS